MLFGVVWGFSRVPDRLQSIIFGKSCNLMVPDTCFECEIGARYALRPD